jgi:SsrA-binding protein
LREGKANIAESYANEEGGEMWLINSYVPEYLQANRFNHETRRRRKILLKAREIARLGAGGSARRDDAGSAQDLFQ